MILNQKMKAPIVTFRANHGKRIVSCVCMAVSLVGVVVGFSMQLSDLVAAGGIMFATFAATLLVSDAIVIDGRGHVIKRRKGVWPVVSEVSRPFSEIDHVCIEQMPTIEPDGSEVTVSRLSLVRKFGLPIVLANGCDQNEALRVEAQQLAKLLGVDARVAGPDVRCSVSVL